MSPNHVYAVRKANHAGNTRSDGSQYSVYQHGTLITRMSPVDIIAATPSFLLKGICNDHRAGSGSMTR